MVREVVARGEPRSQRERTCMGNQAEIVLEPTSDRFDDADERWLDHMAGLAEDLRDRVGTTFRPRPQPGAKGVLNEIVLPLASAGAFTVAADVIKAWLSRDRTRSVRVCLSTDGALQEFELSGASIDNDTFDQVVSSVVGSLPSRA